MFTKLLDRNRPPHGELGSDSREKSKSASLKAEIGRAPVKVVAGECPNE